MNDVHSYLDPSPEQLAPYESLMPGPVAHRHVGANAIYAAAATETDRQLGRLLAHLNARGLAENTIFIFTSDNGPEDIAVLSAAHSALGSAGPFRGRKRTLYEGGIRVPFILRWPAGGAPAGRVDNVTPLAAVDLLPTFCRLAGVSLPQDRKFNGEDMSAVFRGVQRPRHTDLLWEWRFDIPGHVLNRSPMLALRRGDWKLLIHPNRDRVELYDVTQDPSEIKNLADRRLDLVEERAAAAFRWQKSLPAGLRSEGAGANAYPWPQSQR